MALVLIVSSMQKLKELNFEIDESKALQDVLNHGLAKTQEALNQISEALGIDLVEKASNK